MLSVTRRAKDIADKLWPPVVVRYQQVEEWTRRNPQRALWVVGGAGAVLLLVLLITHWNPYKAQYKAFAPILTLVAGLAIAGVTLMRHFAQTEADRQRRITESFSKAIEQLGSDKLEVRLGGIYALERISQESPQDHWMVMANLTTFVRERTRRTERRVRECAYLLWEKAGRSDGRDKEFWDQAVEQETQGIQPGDDIAAVLTVISRRSKDRRDLETSNEKIIGLQGAVLRGNLRKAILKGVDLKEAHLEGADLKEAHLEDAFLSRAHLEGADLNLAHLERAHLEEARLDGAFLTGACLDGANLTKARLDRASLMGAHLEGADLTEAQLDGAFLHAARFKGANLTKAQLDGANLHGAHLRDVRGLTQAQLDRANGNAMTTLPAGLARPAHWTAPDAGTAPAR